MEIKAIQDLDCIDRAKFRYLLPAAPPDDFLDRFTNAQVTIRRFSQFSALSHDMFSISKPDVFRADGVVGGKEILVSFHGDPVDLPLEHMEIFATKLKDVGSITYIRGPAPACHACAQGVLKRCRGRR